jgi:hypothetical protein
VSVAPGGEPGHRLVTWTTAATVAFVVTAASAVAFPGPVRFAAAVYAIVLFIIGTALMLAAFGVAVARSRTETVTLGGTFLLSDSAPPGVQRRFWLLLAVQIVVSLAAASLRPFTPVAFAILAPMSVFGAMAWWGARHGRSPVGDDVPVDD